MVTKCEDMSFISEMISLSTGDYFFDSLCQRQQEFLVANLLHLHLQRLERAIELAPFEIENIPDAYARRQSNQKEVPRVAPASRMRPGLWRRPGIGTTNPQTPLDVVGNITVSGDANINGNIAAKYQDVAEWVTSRQQVTAGTVVTLDITRANTVVPSYRAYDTRVAGVVTEKPGLILGVAGPGKVMVATTGRVKVRVDARRFPIRIGDLLVTSGKSGIAMRSVPIRVGGKLIHRPGTIIGKALEPLLIGEGEILVLLSGQ
jgi:hypothetical protein